MPKARLASLFEGINTRGAFDALAFDLLHGRLLV